jgi:hypothetical protein
VYQAIKRSSTLYAVIVRFYWKLVKSHAVRKAQHRSQSAIGFLLLTGIAVCSGKSPGEPFA